MVATSSAGSVVYPGVHAAVMKSLRILLALAMFVPAAAAPQSRSAWADRPGHRVRTVSVEDGVRLEVLDWGGTGEPLVLLAGLGNTAHVFDDFAPRFRDHYHVLGITRRGFGASSHPDSGYDSATRARDVVAVLDSLRIRRAILVGHSLAGDELSHVAVEHPGRVRALLYLDAGFSYDRDSMSASPPYPPQAVPRIMAADSASVARFEQYVYRRYGVTLPRDELFQIAHFSQSGRLAAFPVLGAYGNVLQAVQPVDLRRIQAPALAIWASYRSGAQRFPGYASFDSVNRSMADQYASAYTTDRAKEIEQFRAEVRRGETLELPGANHYAFISNASQVERALRAFLRRALAPATPP